METNKVDLYFKGLPRETAFIMFIINIKYNLISCYRMISGTDVNGVNGVNDILQAWQNEKPMYPKLDTSC